MPAFVRSDLRAGVAPPSPPPGPPPPWMAKRPAGIRAFTAAVQRDDIDPEQLRRFDHPSISLWVGSATRTTIKPPPPDSRRLFADFSLELFEERHHFDPPHRVEPERLAGSMLALWRRAKQDN